MKIINVYSESVEEVQLLADWRERYEEIYRDTPPDLRDHALHELDEDYRLRLDHLLYQQGVVPTKLTCTA